MTVRVTQWQSRATRLVALVVLVSGVAPVGGAQQRPPPGVPRDSIAIDTTKRTPRRLPNSIPDSLLRPPITPKAAFLHSLAVPGW
ncbi:MAG: hypothetical protein H7099_02195, partial [Gemmatimonadaceae bacterium]|nr:hypothetical protein [Gemmatimonadaceae bacterium]